ncbi:protein odr-4 homolog [Daphnia pulicaria]|uniref:protein odr-4 homolog n=1 Tax=Daphnia pulicaria TaxID=35523 RepID=UPI001EEB753F|nr:protein odr-4 homolog [Daphnia pulicaria]
MGRTVIAEDGIEAYVACLASKKELVVGLIFGQEITSQKSCVIHMARTPEPVPEDNEENELESSSHTKNADKGKLNTEDFDDSLVLDHARQVMRSLPGGITILGVFMVSSVDPFQNSTMNNRLRKLLTSIDLIVGKSSVTVRQQLTCERIALHISNTNIKYNCKTLDIASPIASPKPADWKFVNAAGSPWIELQCTTNVEFFIGLSDSESSGTLRQQLETGIDLYSKAVKQCISLFDGKILSDSDLLDDASTEKSTGKKKSSKQHNSSEERMKTMNVQILIPEIETKQEKQECSSELRFGGQMCIKAYVHGKATVREAGQVIKEDILRSLWARCDMHCDSLIGEEQRGQPDVKAVLHEPPRRVLAPLPFSPISVSDYLFPGEGPADSLASLADLLDLGTLLDGDVQDYWEAAAEVNDAELQIQSDSTLLETSVTKQILATPSTNSRAILLSGLIALLAIVFSYLTLQIFKTN